jgi:hypothetical protein
LPNWIKTKIEVFMNTITVTNVSPVKRSTYITYKLKTFLFQPFLTGIIGFVIALTTLIITYFIAANFFKIGYFNVEATDFIIAFAIGFIPLYHYSLHK